MSISFCILLQGVQIKVSHQPADAVSYWHFLEIWTSIDNYFLFQPPVENGNGVSHETAGETVKRPLDADGDNSSDSLAEPECKRVCSEQPDQKNDPEAPEADLGAGDSISQAPAETPNGVNNTPHPITSGGDWL